MSTSRSRIARVLDGYVIYRSAYFDPDWYLRTYPEVARERFNPALHYLLHGWLEGNDPGPRFGSREYLRANPDVGAAGVNPLLHYERHGRAEGRSIYQARQTTESSNARLAGAPAFWKGQAAEKPGWPVVLCCAHISGHQLFGGERSFLDVLDGLRANDLNVLVTLPSSNNPRYIEAVSRHSMGVYAFPYRQWVASEPEDPSALAAFLEIIDRHHVDCVHVNTIMLREPLTAAYRRGVRRVIHAREIIDLDVDLSRRIGLPPQEIVDQVISRCDVVIANSLATAQAFAKAKNLFIVHNAIAADDFDVGISVDPHRIRFGIVSSNLPKKGISDFVAVARLCEGTCPSARFRIIGPENDYLRSLLSEAPPPGNIEVLGYRETPRDAMAEADVILNLSHFAESFGRTVAEAMAASRPVIAYRWGALPELVEDSVTGRLVAYRDVNAVAACVEEICRAPETIEQMGAAGRKRVIEQYSQARLCSGLRRVYEDVLAAPEAAAPGEPPAPAGLCNADLLLDARSATVVIPVFNAVDCARRCVESVLEHTDPDVRVLVIDDGSSDPEVGPWLEQLEQESRVEVLRNSGNLGYTRTINRGIRFADPDDVVLLNSDTVVTPRWLNYLRMAAYLDPRIGTATAISDNAGAFSVPIPGRSNPKPEGVSHDDYARSISRACIECTPPRVPTGSGFCLYIRRDLIREIGLFDEIAFPRGYGEENDFCMRALRAGWQNVISPVAFVFHVRSASFGSSREELAKGGVDVVTRRYPDYAERVRRAFSDTAMLKVQLLAKEGAENAHAGCAPRRLAAFCDASDSERRPDADLVAYVRGSSVHLRSNISAEAAEGSVECELDVGSGRDLAQRFADWLLKNRVDVMDVRAASLPPEMLRVSRALGVIVEMADGYSFRQT